MWIFAYFSCLNLYFWQLPIVFFGAEPLRRLVHAGRHGRRQPSAAELRTGGAEHGGPRAVGRWIKDGMEEGDLLIQQS